eukprot:TRINITY_DN34133_c0_g1_i1.p1 TRINITY_DN34133_c0_g1~~TRINITY_DN34133_c0_g1_i1.p1  ORF type:complete len:285 (+),score=52.06 TRINITY_DN34133_c0_g1_i1:25-879(+)
MGEMRVHITVVLVWNLLLVGILAHGGEHSEGETLFPPANPPAPRSPLLQELRHIAVSAFSREVEDIDDEQLALFLQAVDNLEGLVTEGSMANDYDTHEVLLGLLLNMNPSFLGDPEDAVLRLIDDSTPDMFSDLFNWGKDDDELEPEPTASRSPTPPPLRPRGGIPATYGHFCGTKSTGTNKDTPRDGVDAACKEHRGCCTRSPEATCHCDRDLVKELRQAIGLCPSEYPHHARDREMCQATALTLIVGVSGAACRSQHEVCLGERCLPAGTWLQPLSLWRSMI